MPFTNTKESGLESLIVSWLVEHNGYEQGTNAEYSRDRALDETRLFRFLSETQPEEMEKLGVFKSDLKRKQFLDRLQGEIAKRGIIDVLRNGIKAYPANLILFYLTPNAHNEKAKTLYGKNIFSVTRQLQYSGDATRLALDLCIFINGLPIITFELKNQLTKQNVDDAVYQYQTDRDPKELLFQFKRCMVHFAVDDARVKFCTRLDGKASWFLPFDRGYKDGAGNPPNPDGIMTDYLWKEILTREMLHLIIENYAQVVEKEDPETKKKSVTQIWPRYHQLDAVVKLLADVQAHGVGRKYLIQHSAGSGKSNTIAWLAHQLIGLEDASGHPLIDSVIVVTDRVILDKQIRDTIKTYPNIIEGNALRMDWNDVVPASELSYIMGNPPFVGGMQMSEPQKADIKNVFGEVNGVGEMDYVCAWYRKASEMIVHTKILCAFVSTNSICQGEQVLTFWKYLMTTYDVKIDFAYTTFVWNSESNGQANVHCVIIGFSNSDLPSIRKLYFDSGKFKECTEINPYLCDAPTCFIESRAKPLCSVPPMRFGSMPRDGGHFVLSPQEREELIRSAPITADWIKPYIGAAEFLNNKMRYCLWLVGVSPALIHQCPQVRRRVDAVRAFRAASKAEGTRKFAETPSLFCQIAQPCASYIMVPKTSSGRRKYIPLGFQNADTIASDLVFLIPNAGLYEFGILMSNVHNSWMRLVAGRLKSDYRYSKDIVYNNFPWCQPTENQRTQIEQTAQGILDARAVYPDCSLSVLYDESLMPPELRKAHQQNDRAVMEAYGMPVKGMTESACVAELMRRYQALTAAKR